MGMHKRDGNIELLRIIMMSGVIILHINGGAGKVLELVEPESINEWIVYFGDYTFVCAVNIFMLISGYYLTCTNKRSIDKPIKLLFQIVVWGELEYFVSILFHKQVFSPIMIIARLIPRNYFVTLFIVTYIISPYINILLDELEKRDILNQFVITMFLLFSVCPTIVDTFSVIMKFDLNALCTIGFYGSEYGYTIVNFVLLWILGAYIRKKDIDLNFFQSVIFYFSFVLIEVFWAKSKMYIGVDLKDSASAYCNPLVILNAVFLFNIFKKIQIKNNKIISSLAKSTLTVLLLHEYFLKQIDFATIVSQPFYKMTSFIIGIVLIIYFICFLLWKIYLVSFERIICFFIDKIKGIEVN